MKNLLSLSGMIITLISCSIQTKAQTGKPGKDENSSGQKTYFNQKLADSLGADQYGMKGYTIVMLTTGTAKIDDKTKKAELMKGHMENICKLAKEGKITVAGPFLEKNQRDYRGMFIFNTQSKEEAESWVKTDSAVAAGIFNYEIFSWYGSAALPLHLKYHDEISKENP